MRRVPQGMHCSFLPFLSVVCSYFLLLSCFLLCALFFIPRLNTMTVVTPPVHLTILLIHPPSSSFNPRYFVLSTSTPTKYPSSHRTTFSTCTSQCYCRLARLPLWSHYFLIHSPRPSFYYVRLCVCIMYSILLYCIRMLCLTHQTPSVSVSFSSS